MKLDMLFEAINYEQMFDKKFTDFLEDMFNISGQAEVKKWIREAKTKLKRSDRIVWFLRLLKMTMLAQAYSFAPRKLAMPDEIKRQDKNTPEQVDATNLQAIFDYIEKEFKKYNSKTKGKELKYYAYSGLSPFSINDSPTTFKLAVAGYTAPLESVLRDIEHYISLPINKIETYIFEWQSWEDIHDELRVFEQAWKEERKGSIPVREKDTIFLDVGDDFYWVDLKKTGCSEEGEAMGHCGNTPMGNNPDITVLSLRQKVKDQKDSSMWKPWATFIFNKKKGTFGEMKGRGNEKPAEKHHKYIIQLLKDTRVKGIEGGGYAPERNFAVTDLPEATWKELVKKKPALMSDLEYLRKISSTDDRAASILKKEFELSKDGKSLVLSNYNNIGDYVKYHEKNSEDMRQLAWALDILTGDEHLEFGWSYKDIWNMITDHSILSKSDSDKLDKLEEEDSTKFDEVKEELIRAYEDAAVSGAQSDMFKAVEKAIKKGLVSDTHDWFEMTLEREKEILDSPLSITLPLDKLSEYLEDDNIGSVEDMFNFIEQDTAGTALDFTVPHYGFDGFDDAYWKEEKDRIFKSI